MESTLVLFFLTDFSELWDFEKIKSSLYIIQLIRFWFISKKVAKSHPYRFQLCNNFQDEWSVWESAAHA